MVIFGNTECPKCSGQLIFYDNVKRILRHKRRDTEWIKLRRLRCINCNSVHRELREDIIQYKQYEAEIIYGVKDGLITCCTVGFEDYPCEMTMNRWFSLTLFLPSNNKNI